MSSCFPLSARLLLALTALVLFPAGGAAARFRVEILTHGKERAYVLRDGQTGASARICPATGNECTVLTLPGPDGRLHDLLPPLRTGTPVTSGTGRGIPILFPWPGRIPGGAYEFQGRRFQLRTAGERVRVAAHGFVEKRRWRVERAEADDGSARLVCRIGAADCPEVRAGYPFNWSLRVTHELSSAGLSLRAEVVNLGGEPMPFGYGLHPWLRAPLGERGRTEECLVRIPAGMIWNAQAVESLTAEQAAAGEKGDGVKWTRSCPPELSLMSPRPLSGRTSAVYTGLVPEGAMVESRVIDPAAGLQAVMRSSPNLGTMVLFRARGGGSVCVEPWSCPPNVFNVAGRIGEASGLVVLAPGGRWESEVRFSLAPVTR